MKIREERKEGNQYTGRKEIYAYIAPREVTSFCDLMESRGESFDPLVIQRAIKKSDCF
jgi:hypothetical protein